MPIAFILVAMISLLVGWHQSENSLSDREAKLTSEAQAVAANMVSYRQQILNYAKHLNASNQLINYPHFLAFNGNAKDFIEWCEQQGNYPQTMTWFTNPLPGVESWIQNGVIYMYYKPATEANASQRGVQSELLKLTKGSFTVGKSVPTP